MGTTLWLARYHDSQKWDDYDQKFGSQLALPRTTVPPHARLIDQPSSVNHTLLVQIFHPNTADDDSLRNWIAAHDGFSAWRPSFKTIKGSMGEWETTRGLQTLVFSRLSDDGWFTLQLQQRLPNGDMINVRHAKLKQSKPLIRQ